MTDRYIPEHRRNNFKAKGTFKPEELRRRRQEQQVEIRKANREENFAKRRGISGRDGQVSVGGQSAGLSASQDSDDEAVNIESQVSPHLSIGTECASLLREYPMAIRIVSDLLGLF